MSQWLVSSLPWRSAFSSTRRRRRVDVILLAIAVVVVGAVATIAAVVGDTERVTRMWVGAEISGDGSARITEVIDYDFGHNGRHGIYRDVPGLPSDAAVNVRSATAPDKVTLIDMGSMTRIRIGDPDRIIKGRHQYRVQYGLDGVARNGRLAWDAVGTGWPVKVNDLEINVVAPYRFTGALCVQGELGSSGRCTITEPRPGQLMTRIDALAERDGVTVYAGSGSRLGVAPRLFAPSWGAGADIGPWLPGLVAGALSALAAAAVSLLVRRSGRERIAAGTPIEANGVATTGETRVDAKQLESLVPVGLGPPPELTPAQGGVLLDETVASAHKVAWLIDAAVDGHLRIESDSAHPVLERREPAQAPAPDSPTVALLDQAFAGRKRLTLGSYDRDFESAWLALGEELEAWRTTCGLWDPAGDRRCRRARLAGFVAAPVGLIVVGLGGWVVSRTGSAWPLIVTIGAVIAGIGAALLIRAWELRVRTPSGAALWLRLESFRRSLAESHARQAEQANEAGELGRYTAWAVALGQIDSWSRAIAGSTVRPARGTPVYFYRPGAARALRAATSASSTVPSSSGSGSSGGGGGVGGGSGGGGGGSW